MRKLAVLCLVALLAGCADRGFSNGTGVWNAIARNEPRVRSDMADQHRAGATLIRLIVPWNGVSTGLDRDGHQTYAWDQTDRLIHAARDNGLEPLVAIHGTPVFQRCHDCGNASVPEDPARFGEFAAAIVQRYQLRYIELGNEPDLWNKHGAGAWGAQPNTPDAYLPLLRAAWVALSPLTPRPFIVLGSLSPVTRQPLAYGTEEFLTELWAKGAGYMVDAVGLHTYPRVWDAAKSERPLAIQRITTLIRPWRPVWITEFGAGTCVCPDGVTEEAQARLVVDIHRWWWQHRDVIGPLFQHTYRDDSDAGSWAGHTGVVDRDGRWKDARVAYERP